MLRALRTMAVASALLWVWGCSGQSEVELRKFPYPYRAGLSISSDIDETWTRAEFLEIQQYLCTRDSTSLGEGLGLEIGNSFWFYDWTGRSSFAYFLGRTAEPSPDARLIDLFVRSGWVDVLHSYGDFSEGGFRRDLVAPCARILQQWRDDGHPVRAWVNHGNPLNRQSIGKLPYQRGDDPGLPEYHTDLLLRTGVEYVGMWEMTHIVGQETRHRLGDVAKEGAVLLVYALNWVRGRPQTRFRFRNDLMRVATLDDGNRVYSFRRFISPGRFEGADVWNLPEQISAGVLEELKSKEGYLVLYTHLGGNAGHDTYIPPDARSALRALANEYDSGEILVTMTTRLLDYCRMYGGVRWRFTMNGDSVAVFITGVDDPLAKWNDAHREFLQGITFYVPRSSRAAVLLHGEMLEIQRNPADRTGRESVTIPWVRREFPTDF